MEPLGLRVKLSRVIQFVIAAVLISIGSVALLANALVGVSVICFCSPSFVLLHRSEATRRVTFRELCIIIALLVALVALIAFTKLFISDLAAEHFFRRPVFVVPFWALAISALFWWWRGERRLVGV